MAGYVCTGPELPRGKAFADQSIVRDIHGCARNVQSRRKLAGGRQGFAAAQTAIENRSPQLAVNLSRQVALSDQADMEFHGT